MDFDALLRTLKTCQVLHRLYDKVCKNKSFHKSLLGIHQMYLDTCGLLNLGESISHSVVSDSWYIRQSNNWSYWKYAYSYIFILKCNFILNKGFHMKIFNSEFFLHIKSEVFY